jgi:hypothetical protein
MLIGVPTFSAVVALVSPRPLLQEARHSKNRQSIRRVGRIGRASVGSRSRYAGGIERPPWPVHHGPDLGVMLFLIRACPISRRNKPSEVRRWGIVLLSAKRHPAAVSARFNRRQLEHRIVRILEKADRRSVGHQLVQERESLGPEFSVEPVVAS